MEDYLIGYCVNKLQSSGFKAFDSHTELVMNSQIPPDGSSIDPFDPLKSYLEVSMKLILDNGDVIITAYLGTSKSNIRIFKDNKLVIDNALDSSNIDYFINNIDEVLKLVNDTKFRIIIKLKIRKLLNHAK